MRRLTTFIATGAWSGLFPVVPGTVGTIPAWLLAWFVFGPLGLMPAAAALFTGLSVWASGKSEGYLGHDSKKIVIDEWAGMFISLLLLPYRLDVYLFAFVCFRFYDVIKPYPAGQCEAWRGGWGVTFDDVFAALYANLTCWLAIVVLKSLGWFGF
jgi:phosphatidylglycerophosphatase A